MKPLPETVEALRALAAEGDTTLGFHLFSIVMRLDPLVPDLVGLSLGVVEEGVTLTLVASDEEVAALDALQYLDGGPCTTAADRADTLATRVGDLLDENQWQLFAEASAEMGVASTLSLPLLDSARVVGGVNLYASTRGAFDGLHEAIAEAIGSDARLAVTNADLSFWTRKLAMDAPTRLREGGDLNIALGIIAARHNVNIPIAREQLRHAAARAGITEVQAARALRHLRP